VLHLSTLPPCDPRQRQGRHPPSAQAIAPKEGGSSANSLFRRVEGRGERGEGRGERGRGGEGGSIFI